MKVVKEKVYCRRKKIKKKGIEKKKKLILRLLIVDTI